MAGRRFSLTDDECSTLKAVLEVNLRELKAQQLSNGNNVIQRYTVDLALEKVGLLYEKLFPKAISTTQK